MFLLRVYLKLIPETQAGGKGILRITTLTACAQVVRRDRLRRVDICELRFPDEDEIIFRLGIKVTYLEHYSLEHYSCQAPWLHMLL